MLKIHFLLLKKFKNTESAQLWTIMHILAMTEAVD